VCNLERSSDLTLSEKFEKFEETDKNEMEEDEVFDEQNELNKLYHYPKSHNFSKFQEKFKCPSEFYMILDCNRGKIGFGSETDWYGWCFDSLKGLNLYPGKVNNRFQFETI